MELKIKDQITRIDVMINNLSNQSFDRDIRIVDQDKQKEKQGNWFVLEK